MLRVMWRIYTHRTNCSVIKFTKQTAGVFLQYWLNLYGFRGLAMMACFSCTPGPGQIQAGIPDLHWHNICTLEIFVV